MHRFVADHLDEVLARFEVDARQRLPDAPLDATQVDNVRTLLLALSRPGRPDAAAGSAPGGADRETIQHCADILARARLKQQVSLGDVIAELLSLQRIVVQLWLDSGMTEDWPKSDFMAFVARMDDAIRQCIDAYNERVARMRELFLGALGHDLRSPLSAVVVGAEYLLKSEKLEAEPLKVAVRIRNAAARMQGMLDDLVDFTRTRLGHRLPVTLHRMNLSAVVEQSVSEIAAVHPDTQVKTLLDGDLWGEWDESRLQRLLVNLLGNAALYGRAGTPVEVEARGTEQAVELQVRNQGDPIPADVAARIFDPLVRGLARGEDRRMRHKGMGLGLYICREVARAHHGQISVVSTDSGTAFVVTLPKQPPTPPSTAPGRPLASGAG